VGQHRDRNAEEIEQAVVPASGMKIEKHGAGGVAGVGDVAGGRRSTSKAARYHGARMRDDSLRRVGSVGHVIEDPGILLAEK